MHMCVGCERTKFGGSSVKAIKVREEEEEKIPPHGLALVTAELVFLVASSLYRATYLFANMQGPGDNLENSSSIFPAYMRGKASFLWGE